MSLKPFYISLITIVLIFTCLNIKEDKSRYTLVTKTKVYNAGDIITLEFDFNGDSDVILYCSNTYGSLILKPEIGNTLKFVIPEILSIKSGILNWELLSDSELNSGQIKIHPKNEISEIETYIGPPSIEAGGNDYTMVVALPTDKLDNPLIDGTKVSVKHQFLEIEERDMISTKHGYGYKNLYSYQKSGRMLINTECLGLNSKEFDINIVPAIPTNFTISTDRVHNYADGNQITTFRTSTIKDRYNNIVSDGTFVSFFITNKDGYKTETSGATINGVATAKVLHPDRAEEWDVKAYIEGIANSDIITISYEKAITDFKVSFSKNNRTVTVGPLQSFMNQYIPNGLNVTLKLFKKGNFEDKITAQSVDGFATFKLKKDRFPKGYYTIEIEVAGIKKSFTKISYE
ncbi:MAG: hypothetical protein ED556_09495 [Winogradskyella sp.]|uniref:hypothetical protein n=1 Tax=Winogradskyella sp. TaxID=1883156 RepID=UPI000F3D2100|nr:hypothetical protein [Winogradskyella sp.]RNC86508.1 MAG: hypothetical protein ED556_09495 [Winogradskyella sp.]